MKRAFLVTLALIAAIGFVALGVWQIERRAWKLDLIARVEAGVNAATVPPPAAFDPRRDEYRRVRVTGAFQEGDTLVQALTERGAGFWVLTSLRTGQGVVLINRGFVPGPAAPPAPAGQTSITGLLRVSEPKGGFLRANDPGANRWYSRDVPAIAQARGLGPVAPYFIDADATPNPGGYPVGGLTVIAFSNNHLIYALSWFALAGLSGAAAWLLLRQRALR